MSLRNQKIGLTCYYYRNLPRLQLGIRLRDGGGALVFRRAFYNCFDIRHTSRPFGSSQTFFFLGLVVAKNISDSVDEWYYMAVKKG
jgi:hypothetical protein